MLIYGRAVHLITQQARVHGTLVLFGFTFFINFFDSQKDIWTMVFL